MSEANNRNNQEFEKAKYLTKVLKEIGESKNTRAKNSPYFVNSGSSPFNQRCPSIAKFSAATMSSFFV